MALKRHKDVEGKSHLVDSLESHDVKDCVRRTPKQEEERETTVAMGVCAKPTMTSAFEGKGGAREGDGEVKQRQL
jgi:hypothetical protein